MGSQQSKQEQEMRKYRAFRCTLSRILNKLGKTSPVLVSYPITISTGDVFYLNRENLMVYFPSCFCITGHFISARKDSSEVYLWQMKADELDAFYNGYV